MKDLPSSSSKRILLSVLLSLFVIIAWTGVAVAPTQEPPSQMILIEGDTLVGNTPLIALNGVLGALVGENELDYHQAVLLNKIIECESNWRCNVCNEKYGCKSGQGVAQLIPGTVKYCEEKLNKKIDPFNLNDNVECAVWLLTNEGWQHWGTEITDWGSYQCFKEFID